MNEHRRFEWEWLEKVPRMRMLCVTEEHDNLLMWAHYANNHTGAVLELRVMPEEDNAAKVRRRTAIVAAGRKLPRRSPTLWSSRSHSQS